ncbi:alpha-L-rhamnosidase N-terminal domain-containing protein [Siphonobacter sp. BAB-5385]|uniref:alpha-L-rhamnosidase N-terminal domain-containing protein n=1 Tax=Siphonobacter sp. BAB-5385 TaxID=1864822 RepID=UPI001C3E3384|nr:alpha-L-rhamnosidase N-terminal domain-containing protein [Siphonobacter sp. BAB-5385]
MRGFLRTVILPLTLYCLMILPVPAQIRLMGYQQAHINPELFQRAWAARWISVPNASDNAYGVYHFRKSFDLTARPEHFYVHVSADNRYKLFVNGKLVSLGPARSDPYNWNFETVDLGPHLKKGKNVLAAIVWNFAEYKPVAQMSFNRTEFLLQGDTEAEQLVNTDTSWRCLRNPAYTPWQKPVYGYYVAGPGDNLNAQPYPWGWQQPSFNDQAWVPARQGMPAATKGHRDYPNRLLVPSPIPPMEMATERLARIRLSEGMEKPASGF